MTGNLSGSPDVPVTWGDHEIYHAGNAQVRVGRFTVTILEMTHLVTFATPMLDTGYEVFMLPLGNLGGQFWATNLTTDGFTANFSSGANITFSYMAVEDT